MYPLLLRGIPYISEATMGPRWGDGKSPQRLGKPCHPPAGAFVHHHHHLGDDDDTTA